MMEVFEIREEIEETQNEEELFPIYVNIQQKYDEVFEKMKDMWAEDKFEEVAETLKEAKYWEKILSEIEERKGQI